MVGEAGACPVNGPHWLASGRCAVRQWDAGGRGFGVGDDVSAICLAVLRRDGFISLDAGEKQGTIVTKPFKVPSNRLFVNVDALKGELRAEVLGKAGNMLAASAPMKGDLARGEVEWRKGNIADLKGKAVTLRFKLRNASFYSYWFE